jgi:hypothetical protein
MTERLLRVAGLDLDAAVEAAENAGARVAHRFGDVLVVESQEPWTAVRARLPRGLNEVDVDPEEIVRTLTADARDENLLAAAYWLRRTAEYRRGKEHRPAEGQEWGDPDTFE